MRAEAAPRLDLLLVADMVEPGSRVLDIGCGDGALLALLRDRRNVDGRGIELSREGVSDCMAKGLPVIQGDADTDLAGYPDDAFDYVILSQTIQATRQPRTVLENLLRIGRRAIVSFPNFGHWRIRWELGLRGRMPVTENLPHSWYDTPNIHFCTIRDFVHLCREVGARMEKAVALNAGGQPVRVAMPWWVWNMFGEQAVFLLRGKAEARAADLHRRKETSATTSRETPVARFTPFRGLASDGWTVAELQKCAERLGTPAGRALGIALDATRFRARPEALPPCAPSARLH